MAELITSRQNPRIKTLLALRKRRERLRLGLTLIEGYEELSLAIKAGAKPTEVYYCPDLMSNRAQLELLMHHGLANAEPFELSAEVFERAAYRQGPDGWLAVCDAVPTALDHIQLKTKTPLVVVVEAVEKPGNLGAILRTADAAGVDAVIAANSSTDWSNPNTVRASKGAIFSVPVADASNNQVLTWLEKNHMDVIAATSDTTKIYTSLSMKQATALLLGTEKQGLSDFWLTRASQKARIPMVGQVDSLNVATSAAILIYESLRQRAL